MAEVAPPSIATATIGKMYFRIIFSSKFMGQCTAKRALSVKLREQRSVPNTGMMEPQERLADMAIFFARTIRWQVGRPPTRFSVRGNAACGVRETLRRLPRDPRSGSPARIDRCPCD